MLTGDLVRVAVRGRELSPLLVDPTRDELTERASELVSLLHEAVAAGWTRGRVDEAVEDWIGDARDVRLLRGLAKIALDRGTFETEVAVPPLELRRRLFEAAREMGPLDVAPGPLGRPVAADVLARVAGELGLAPEVVEDAMYADLQEARRIRGLAVPDGEWLLRRYNVALVQAVLLHAERVVVRLRRPTVPRTRQLFRHVKFYQLLHAAERDGDALVLTLDGPTSLFHQSTRYGLQLASFFPALLLQDGGWSLEATVLWTRARHQKVLRVDDGSGLVSHYADTGAYTTREQQWFAERFDALETPWRRTDGVDPIHLGGKAVVLPDFSFHDGRRVAHLDIVGYWRRDYLARRVELLREHGPGNLVLAVSRKLAGAKEALADFAGEIVEFSEVVPAKRVLEAIERVGR